MQLIPTEKTFGNVTLYISIIPSNNSKKVTKLKSSYLEYEQIFLLAFKNNSAFSFVKTIEGLYNNPITYVVFKNEVVQFFNDSLSDIYGQCSTLYQEIAKDIFKDIECIYYCTDKLNNTVSFSHGAFTISTT